MAAMTTETREKATGHEQTLWVGLLSKFTAYLWVGVGPLSVVCVVWACM